MSQQPIQDDKFEDEIEDALNISQIKVSDAVLTGTDWTTETILNQLERGNIDLNPSFQRRDAWTPTRKSRFIESLFLGLPIPQIVLAENKVKRGAFLILDGKQRLLSLYQFMSGTAQTPLRLKNLEKRTDLDNNTYQDLISNSRFSEDLNAFQNQTIRTIVIKNWPNEDFLYLVFLRLNTGSVQLSPQELRQALKPGSFTTYADDFTVSCVELKKLFNSDTPDFRMRDIELFIRYIAFNNRADKYRGNLKMFLDETCEYYNGNWSNESSLIEKQARAFEESLEFTRSCFGDIDYFRKYQSDHFEPRINKAVFDIMIYYFSDDKNRKLLKDKCSAVKKAFIDLCKTDNDFMASIERTTKSLDSTRTRFTKWASVLSKITGKTIKTPGIPAA